MSYNVNGVIETINLFRLRCLYWLKLWPASYEKDENPILIDLIKLFSVRLYVSNEWFNDSNITIMVTITCRKKNQLMNSFGELDSKDSSHWDESQPRPRENSVWIVTF